MKHSELLAGSRSNEEALLCLFLRDDATIHEALSYGLEPGQLHDRAYRVVFRGMLDDLRAGRSPDEATLFDRHATDVGPAKAWGSLVSLNDTIERISACRPRRANLPTYIEAVFEAARRRKAVDSARLLVSMDDDGAPTKDLVRLLQGTAVDLDRTTRQSADLPSIEDIAREACERAVSVASGKTTDNIIRFGLRDLDAKFFARQGDYVLVGARPSMGKTHFLLSIMEQIARESGPVQFHSIEMREQAIGDRLFAHDAEGMWQHDESAAEAASRAVLTRWSRLPIRVDTRSRTLSSITSALRVAKQQRGIVAAGIDYLQLMRLDRMGNREQEVANASRELACLASELDIVLLVCCQLNRQLEQRPLHDRRPRMSDLRESGQLEQDADGILFLFREAAYNPAALHPEILEVGIAKQRNGRAPRTAFCKYTPGSGFVSNLPAAEEMRASTQRKRKA